MTSKPLSDTRAAIAELIEAGRVRYALPDWFIDGDRARGWDGRTLREMHRDGLIARPQTDGPVKLTAAARTLLEESRGS